MSQNFQLPPNISRPTNVKNDPHAAISCPAAHSTAGKHSPPQGTFSNKSVNLITQNARARTTTSSTTTTAKKGRTTQTARKAAEEAQKERERAQAREQEEEMKRGKRNTDGDVYDNCGDTEGESTDDASSGAPSSPDILTGEKSEDVSPPPATPTTPPTVVKPEPPSKPEGKGKAPESTPLALPPIKPTNIMVEPYLNIQDQSGTSRPKPEQFWVDPRHEFSRDELDEDALARETLDREHVKRKGTSSPIPRLQQSSTRLENLEKLKGQVNNAMERRLKCPKQPRKKQRRAAASSVMKANVSYQFYKEVPKLNGDGENLGSSLTDLFQNLSITYRMTETNR
ncbi:hypothetical protein BDK51DRAFT_28961 [Blyttiomyces helicus]|uniref:Uncharacterized protein n=1 Tax=Blyttiomyces helicus TaxID=388810 RepID=A0A4P9WNN3_9FUNG|nr:hypothetical protein BDK51DRAFT_28961 [Blyttiomyces helicus]|eukprot:RKO94102.1 hypothetical protein BDK51DRAFT_28961 [Blyttiomyces helicus]